MRILALSSPSGGQCGIGDYNGDLCAALHAQGHQVDLLPLVRRGDRTTMVREFQRRISNYDAVILQYDGSLYGDTLAEMARNFATIARSCKRPAIAILHELMSAFPGRREQLRRPWKLNRTSWRTAVARCAMIDAINEKLTVFVHGEYMRREWIRIGVTPDRVKAIIYPMQAASSVIQPRPLPKGASVELTMFGFVTEYKGYEVALNAMRVLPENYKLTIAGGRVPFAQNDRAMDAIHCFVHTGTWPYHEQFPRIPCVGRRYSRAERESMESRVKFTGHVPSDRVPDIMNRTDIALAPYRRSNGSAALADYVEYGRPTIVSGLPVFCDLESEANCFRIVATDAPFELAHSIRDLAANLSERRRMFEAARAFAEMNSFAALAGHCISVFTDTSQVKPARSATIEKLTDHPAHSNSS